MNTSLRLNLTTELKHQNAYTIALESEFSKRAFSEVRAPLNRGVWRENVFQVATENPLDLEIGTGNGLHFAHRVSTHTQRCYLGIEVKYKPLIQTIRRTYKANLWNGAVARYHAMQIEDLFAPLELNDVYIHFPDPWTSPRKPKNRIFQAENLNKLFAFQRPGAKLEFKTDSAEAFKWGLLELKNTPYELEFVTHDLHHSPEQSANFVTAFERIFLRQGMAIHFLRLRKNA